MRRPVPVPPTCQQGAGPWARSPGLFWGGGTAVPVKLSGHLDKRVITPLIQGLYSVPNVTRHLGQLLPCHIHAMHGRSDSEVASLATRTKGPRAPPKSMVYLLPKNGRLSKPSLQFGASLVNYSHAVSQHVLSKPCKKKGIRQKGQVGHWAHRIAGLELEDTGAEILSFLLRALPSAPRHPRELQAASRYSSCPAVLPTLPCLVKFK